ncbi:MAG: TadE/TadG family type IV pilus assembly protein [Paracoccaceae bacterium]
MLRVRSRARGFLRQENGSVTIEAVLWMPVFVALLCIIAQASIAFGRKAEVLRIVQDANRAMSIGRFREVQETEDYVIARISDVAPHATVDTQIFEGAVKTVVQIPASDLVGNISYGFLGSVTLTVSAEHMLEA